MATALTLKQLLNNSLFDSVDAGFKWIESFYNAEKSGTYDSRVYRLDRMQELLKFFGNPHNQIKTIHIAGSKGKGSTATYIANIFSAFDLKVGLYTSPHLTSYKERITLCGNFFSDAIYLSQINIIAKKLPAFVFSSAEFESQPPTVFELLTLLAFLVFKKAKVDLAVIETGLGGRLDATNCITPLLSVITNIEKEHTQYLGKTIKKIASQKAGIIKKGIPFLLTKQNKIAQQEFIKTAYKLGAPFFETSRVLKTQNSLKLQSWNFPIPSSVQKRNVENAVASALICLPLLNITPNIEKIKTAIEKTLIPGRMQKISENPLLYIDGAHTPVSFKSAVDTFLNLTKQRKDSKAALIFCAVEGKAILNMAKRAIYNFDKVIICSAGNFRKNDPTEIYKIFLKLQKSLRYKLFCFFQKKSPCQIQLEKNATAAIKNISKSKEEFATLASGSFYLVGEVIKANQKNQKKSKQS